MTVSLLKGLGAFCRSCGAVGQADQLPGERHQLAAGRIREVVGQEEEVGEVDAAAAVEVEAGVAAAEGVCKQEEVGEAGLAVAVEVGGGFRGGGEGDRVEAGHGCHGGVGPWSASQGQGAGGAAVFIGGGRGWGERPLTRR